MNTVTVSAGCVVIDPVTAMTLAVYLTAFGGESTKDLGDSLRTAAREARRSRVDVPLIALPWRAEQAVSS